MKLSPVLKEKNRLKKSLMLHGLMGVVTARLDPTLLSFQLVKNNKRKV